MEPLAKPPRFQTSHETVGRPIREMNAMAKSRSVGHTNGSVDRYAAWAAALILVAAASVKLLSLQLWGHHIRAQLLGPSLVFPPLSELSVVVLAVATEYGIAVVLVLSRSPILRFSLISWLSTVFLTYHLCLFAVVGGDLGCHCLGIWPGEWQHRLDVLALALLGALLVLGWGGLAAHGWCRLRSRPIPGEGAEGIGRTLMRTCEHALAPSGALLTRANGRCQCKRPLAGSSRSGLSLLVAPCLLLIGSLIQAHGSPWIEVRVTVSQTNFPPGLMKDGLDSGSEPKGRGATWSVRCITGSDRWLIEQTTGNSVITSFFDGTNLLSTTKFTGKLVLPEAMLARMKKVLPPSKMKSIEKEPDTNWVHLTIYPNPVPLDDLGAHLPWLAFCSGSHLRRPNHRVPLMGSIISASPGAFGFRDETKTFPDDLGLPENLRLFASAKLFAKSLTDDSLSRVGRKPAEVRAILHARSGFPDGMLVANYEVLAYTNCGGVTVPTLFTYEEFGARGRDKPSLKLAAVGRADSIQPGTEPQMILVPGQRYTVVDYRFRHPDRLVDQIQYVITNGLIPTTNDAGLRSLFDRRVAVAPRDPIKQVHFMLYIFFVALLAGPVVLLARAVRRRARETSLSEN